MSSSSQRNIIKKVLKQFITEEISSEKKESKQRCLTTNTIPLDEIIGGNSDYKGYVKNLNKRNGGISGMIDTLDILKTLRLHPDVTDKEIGRAHV